MPFLGLKCRRLVSGKYWGDLDWTETETHFDHSLKWISGLHFIIIFTRFCFVFVFLVKIVPKWIGCLFDLFPKTFGCLTKQHTHTHTLKSTEHFEYMKRTCVCWTFKTLHTLHIGFVWLVNKWIIKLKCREIEKRTVEKHQQIYENCTPFECEKWQFVIYNRLKCSTNNGKWWFEILFSSFESTTMHTAVRPVLLVVSINNKLNWNRIELDNKLWSAGTGAGANHKTKKKHYCFSHAFDKYNRRLCTLDECLFRSLCSVFNQML